MRRSLNAAVQMIGELLVELGRDDLVIIGEIRGHLVALAA